MLRLRVYKIIGTVVFRIIDIEGLRRYIDLDKRTNHWPGGTKSLPAPMSNYPMCSVTFTCEQFHKNSHKPNMRSEISLTIPLWSFLPGTSEFITSNWDFHNLISSSWACRMRSTCPLAAVTHCDKPRLCIVLYTFTGQPWRHRVIPMVAGINLAFFGDEVYNRTAVATPRRRFATICASSSVWTLKMIYI